MLTKKQSRIFFLPLWSIRPHKPYQNLRPRDSEGLCFIRILKAKSGSREPSPRSRWDEIMRIAQAQVVVTAEMETVDGDKIRVRQSTEAEDELAVIYSLLDVNANPIGKV